MGSVGGPSVIAVLVEPGTLTSGASLILADEETHHLRVRRPADGETVRLLDGAGGVATGILSWSGKQATVAVDTAALVEPPAPLVLAVGAGDRERFGWLAEKSAELGVTDIIPLDTSHTSGVASRVREPHLAKLQSRAREALKQSGAAWAPRIHPPHSIAELCALPAAGFRWLARPGGATPPVRLTREPVLVAIGPEGGWTGAEIDQLLAARFESIALAVHILRFETAALAAAATVGVARLRGAHD